MYIRYNIFIIRIYILYCFFDCAEVILKINGDLSVVDAKVAASGDDLPNNTLRQILQELLHFGF